MKPHEEPNIAHHWRVARHMVSASGAFLPVSAATLALGMAIYHWVEGLAWSDAFLNAAMLLGGMGPVDPIHTELGKWLVGFYALLAGLVVIVLAGVMLSPVMHHVLHRLHVKDQK
jgi:hypothetical protein